MASTFLSVSKFLIPSWLQGPVVDSLMTVIDDTVDRARQGLQARFPSRAQPDALALIGADRALLRGRAETDAHYALRLAAWRTPYGHRTRGSAFALLDQVFNYFGAYTTANPLANVQSIDQNGTRHYLSRTGPSFGYGFYWDWDGLTGYPNRGRFWLILRGLTGITAGPLIGASTGLWGGAIGAGPGKAIGTSGVDAQDVTAIQGLLTGPTPWRPAGTTGQWAIVSFTSSANPAPTGNYDRYENRDPAYRYWRLS